MLVMKGINKIAIPIFCIVIAVILIWIYYIHQIRNVRAITKMFSNDSVFPKKHLFAELFFKKFFFSKKCLDGTTRPHLRPNTRRI